MRKRPVNPAALLSPRRQAEVMRAELAQSWRDSDVELGLKQARRSRVSAAAAKALEATFGISDLIRPWCFRCSILSTACSAQERMPPCRMANPTRVASLDLMSVDWHAKRQSAHMVFLSPVLRTVFLQYIG